jgi:hypothetical protein
MVLGGGTGTAWHICKTIKEYYKFVHLIVCDINPKHLVHSAILADDFIAVLPIADPQYEHFMYELFFQYQVNILIPIIDLDLKIFCCNNKKLIENNIFSTGPNSITFDTLSNKKNMYRYLCEIGITTPRIFDESSINPEREYYIKDIIGFGSRGAYKTFGKTFDTTSHDKIIQEICRPPEITVDVLRYNKKIFIICRERIEIKSGVSTKVRIFYDKEIYKIIEKIACVIELPTVSCIQFMKNNNDAWTLTDFNLRSGAGTAMSAIVGFQCIHAALAIWLDAHENIESLLKYPVGDKYVVRTYQEIITQ